MQRWEGKYHPLMLNTLTSAASPWRHYNFTTHCIFHTPDFDPCAAIATRQPLWIHVKRYAWAASLVKHGAYRCRRQKTCSGTIRGFTNMEMYWYSKPLKGVVLIWLWVMWPFRTDLWTKVTDVDIRSKILTICHIWWITCAATVLKLISELQKSPLKVCFMFV